MQNIESLLSLPTGCGEQSMVKFVPDLYIARYLKARGRWSGYWKDRITSFLDAGYQRQLSYQRFDGGFSAFGDSDESGSTWLTAFVSRSFNEAREFIYVDTSMLIKAIDWLLDRQNSDGSFTEIGKVLDQSTQASKGGPALTAYVLLALLQNRDLAPLEACKNDNSCARAQKLRDAITNATTYLERRLPSTEDVYALAVMSYALGEAKSRRAAEAFQKLRAKAKYSGSLMYWSANTTDTSEKPFYTNNIRWQPIQIQARPVDIQITSYALLSFIGQGNINEGLPALRWLTAQRNSRGGFASTQDTVVALQALSAFASTMSFSRTNFVVRATGDRAEVLDFSVNQNNAMTLQTKKFQNSPKKVDISISGTGVALAEVDQSFNVIEEITTPSFDVSTVMLDDGINSFNLMICTNWLWDHKTGMVVQEIGIPSGFNPDLSTLGNVVGMKRSERKGDTVAIYFDEIGKISTCYSLLMTRVGKVAKSAQSYIRTFDYYDPANQSTVFYHPRRLRDSSICDVCRECCN